MNKFKPVQRNEKIESVVFRKQIAASTSGQMTERIKGEGTIEGARIIFPPGPAGTLHVTLYVKRLGDKLDSLFTFPTGGNQYVSGDDEMLQYPTTFAVKNDEEIVVVYDNTDAVNAHELKVDVFVDYYGGENRIIGGVI